MSGLLLLLLLLLLLGGSGVQQQGLDGSLRLSAQRGGGHKLDMSCCCM